jgi:hypothetical protein
MASVLFVRMGCNFAEGYYLILPINIFKNLIMTNKYSPIKLALCFLTIIFSSCEKCTIHYIDTSSVISKLNLQVEFFEAQREDLEDELMVGVNFEDQEFKKYVDSIEVIPIFNTTDTLKLEKNENPIYLFNLDKKDELKLLDVNIILHRAAHSKADTCIVFRNLKRVKHCHTSHSFH